MADAYLGDNCYHVDFAPVFDFAKVALEQRQAAIDQTLRRYAALLEQRCLQASYNWFNVYDFWKLALRP
jgi:predicted LPLAT superfamily acyltransferase